MLSPFLKEGNPSSIEETGLDIVSLLHRAKRVLTERRD